jgi:uncharacterized protein YjiS (DUF1127 family)
VIPEISDFGERARESNCHCRRSAMTTPLDTAATAVPPPPLSPTLSGMISALRALARRITGWLDGRRRVRDDRRTLAGMSDRELLDIGIDRASVKAVVAGTWVRETPG